MCEDTDTRYFTIEVYTGIKVTDRGKCFWCEGINMALFENDEKYIDESNEK